MWIFQCFSCFDCFATQTLLHELRYHRVMFAASSSDPSNVIVASASTHIDVISKSVRGKFTCSSDDIHLSITPDSLSPAPGAYLSRLKQLNELTSDCALVGTDRCGKNIGELFLPWKIDCSEASGNSRHRLQRLSFHPADVNSWV